MSFRDGAVSVVAPIIATEGGVAAVLSLAGGEDVERARPGRPAARRRGRGARLARRGRDEPGGRRPGDRRRARVGRASSRSRPRSRTTSARAGRSCSCAAARSRSMLPIALAVGARAGRAARVVARRDLGRGGRHGLLRVRGGRRPRPGLGRGRARRAVRHGRRDRRGGVLRRDACAGGRSSASRSSGWPSGSWSRAPDDAESPAMTRFHELPDGARLAYDDAGKGRPVVLIHGVCMSRRFFERNTEPLAERFRVVSVDLRGHGESPASEGGHTVAQYAQDVKHLLDTLGLEDAVLVGWSMGSFVIWDLVRQFGAGGIAGHVNVSQGPTDLNRDGWELGIFPLEELFSTLAAAQDDFHARDGPLRPRHAQARADRRRPGRPGGRDAAHRRERRHLHPARPVAAGLPRVRRELRGADAARVGRRREGRRGRQRPVAAGDAAQRRAGRVRASRATARCGRSPRASTRSSATGSRRCPPRPRRRRSAAAACRRSTCPRPRSRRS